MNIDTVICGDNVAVLKTFPDACIDLTVTSPPYDSLRTYNGYSWDFDALKDELYRVTKPGGVVVWVVGDATINGSETGTSFRQALGFMAAGFNLHDTMIYRKQNYIPLTHRRYEQAFEFMFVFAKGKPKTFNPLMVPTKGGGLKQNLKREGYGFKEGAFRRRAEDVTVKPEKRHENIFDYACGNNGVDHPAPFPAALVRDQITTWSNRGEFVLDPFFGAGTTGKVAKLWGRHYIGIEIDEKYCDLAQRHIAAGER